MQSSHQINLSEEFIKMHTLLNSIHRLVASDIDPEVIRAIVHHANDLNAIVTKLSAQSKVGEFLGSFQKLIPNIKIYLKNPTPEVKDALYKLIDAAHAQLMRKVKEYGLNDLVNPLETQYKEIKALRPAQPQEPVAPAPAPSEQSVPAAALATIDPDDVADAIALVTMTDPVVVPAKNGFPHFFDRANIQAWIAKAAAQGKQALHPMTDEPISLADLKTAHEKAALIKEYQKQKEQKEKKEEAPEQPSAAPKPSQF